MPVCVCACVLACVCAVAKKPMLSCPANSSPTSDNTACKCNDGFQLSVDGGSCVSVAEEGDDSLKNNPPADINEANVTAVNEANVEGRHDTDPDTGIASSTTLTET